MAIRDLYKTQGRTGIAQLDFIHVFHASTETTRIYRINFANSQRNIFADDNWRV
jgi:hypothetical protein